MDAAVQDVRTATEASLLGFRRFRMLLLLIGGRSKRILFSAI